MCCRKQMQLLGNPKPMALVILSLLVCSTRAQSPQVDERHEINHNSSLNFERIQNIMERQDLHEVEHLTYGPDTNLQSKPQDHQQDSHDSIQDHHSHAPIQTAIEPRHTSQTLSVVETLVKAAPQPQNQHIDQMSHQSVASNHPVIQQYPSQRQVSSPQVNVAPRQQQSPAPVQQRQPEQLEHPQQSQSELKQQQPQKIPIQQQQTTTQTQIQTQQSFIQPSPVINQYRPHSQMEIISPLREQVHQSQPQPQPQPQAQTQPQSQQQVQQQVQHPQENSAPYLTSVNQEQHHPQSQLMVPNHQVQQTIQQRQQQQQQQQQQQLQQVQQHRPPMLPLVTMATVTQPSVSSYSTQPPLVHSQATYPLYYGHNPFIEILKPLNYADDNIVTLNLSHSHIYEIDSDAFVGQRFEHIDLSNNKLGLIHSRSFRIGPSHSKHNPYGNNTKPTRRPPPTNPKSVTIDFSHNPAIVALSGAFDHIDVPNCLLNFTNSTVELKFGAFKKYFKEHPGHIVDIESVDCCEQEWLLGYKHNFVLRTHCEHDPSLYLSKVPQQTIIDSCIAYVTRARHSMTIQGPSVIHQVAAAPSRNSNSHVDNQHLTYVILGGTAMILTSLSIYIIFYMFSLKAAFVYQMQQPTSQHKS